MTGPWPLTCLPLALWKQIALYWPPLATARLSPSPLTIGRIGQTQHTFVMRVQLHTAQSTWCVRCVCAKSKVHPVSFHIVYVCAEKNPFEPSLEPLSTHIISHSSVAARRDVYTHQSFENVNSKRNCTITRLAKMSQTELEMLCSFNSKTVSLWDIQIQWRVFPWFSLIEWKRVYSDASSQKGVRDVEHKCIVLGQQLV